ncbi:hypothetical protein SCNU_14641 [Gordonia neofelifaecis NRRL B-59395]|uniref:Uncharacterized protein n=1 Tax=Gordonia neofelifaecis NRRL B-59395 TaxID=644548 RepID=F1YLY4_9ACTN|nr:hypothetical protein SCNU_14641 [Gordonia neofelifaecis NRRL B-59395]
MDNGWPTEIGDEHAVTELVSHLAGALSPYGDTQLPQPAEDLPFIQSHTVVNR